MTTRIYQEGNPTYPILQTVTFSTTTQDSTTSTSFVASSTAVSITPKVSTSKMLVLVQGGLGGGYSSIFRDSTNLFHSTGGCARSDNSVLAGMVAIDSPGTTSPVTYRAYFRSLSGSNSIWNNNYSGAMPSVATIQVFEIAN